MSYLYTMCLRVLTHASGLVVVSINDEDSVAEVEVLVGGHTLTDIHHTAARERRTAMYGGCSQMILSRLLLLPHGLWTKEASLKTKWSTCVYHSQFFIEKHCMRRLKILNNVTKHKEGETGGREGRRRSKEES